mmetsp:Transcript_13378/g.26446  ORF Transcript_13378/g.26446 Transcript_13378/m.26446 type:complete len:137 (-) Transcript_13378:1921-2331(-)
MQRPRTTRSRIKRRTERKSEPDSNKRKTCVCGSQKTGRRMADFSFLLTLFENMCSYVEKTMQKRRVRSVERERKKAKLTEAGHFTFPPRITSLLSRSERRERHSTDRRQGNTCMLIVYLSSLCLSMHQEREKLHIY